MASQPVPAQESIGLGEDFELDLRLRQLRRADRVLKLERIPTEVLILLVEARGQVVTREQIVERIWGGGVFLDTDNSINGAIRKIRQVLRDNSDQPRFVQTVTGKGYRFVGPVQDVPAVKTPASPVPSAPTVVEAKPSAHRWWYFSAIAMLFLAGTVIYLKWFRPQPEAAPAKLMLAVLPFENLTGDAGQEYFSDGFTEEMITQLGRLDPAHLAVIARTSVMQYKNRHEAIDRIGRELGVQYVLEGSIRRDSDHVRITAQLIQVRDQTHLLAREYDRELKGVLVVQNEIAQEIADEIQLTFNDRNQPAGTARRSTLSPEAIEAHDLYLKGRYFWNERSTEGFRRAVECFQQAVAKDPNYARGYAGLADSYALMSSYYFGPQGQLNGKARAAALQALQIDDGLAEAHASLALISQNYDWDWATAEKEFRRAIQLDANYATAHHWYAEFLAFQGRFDEALSESERARQLDPLSLIIAADHAAILVFAHRPDQAIPELRRVLDMDPKMSRAQSVLMLAYELQGRYEDALGLVGGMERFNDGAWSWAGRASIYARAGQRQQAEEALSKAQLAIRRQKLDPSPILASVYAAMGDTDHALACLQGAYKNHSVIIATLKVDPSFDSLRSDPRFQDLLHRVGFTQ